VLYPGFSVAYGHRLVRWADVLRTLLAVAVATGVVATPVWWVDDRPRTAALEGLLPLLGIVLVVEVLSALSYTVWPRPARARNS
jgi:hypothetical protein